jgi:hypothetical protein
MSIFNSSIGFGAYANHGLGYPMIMGPAITGVVAQNVAIQSKTPEQHRATAAKLAKEAKTPEDLERAKNVLAMAAMKESFDKAEVAAQGNWFEKLPIEKKLAVGGAVLGGVVLIIFALKS